MDDQDRERRRRSRSGTTFGAMALVMYLIGGLLTFGGLVLAMVRWQGISGEGRYGAGLLLVVSGIVLSIAGVLIMRVVRNRTGR